MLLQACTYYLNIDRWALLKIRPAQMFFSNGMFQVKGVIIKFSQRNFLKADVRKDTKGSHKRPLVTGSRNVCATLLFAHEPEEENI